MEREKRDARFGRESRDARFGRERRDAWFGDSEWLEDSAVQGTCPFSHHRIYTHIYKGAPGGSGGSGPTRTGKARPATVERERRSGAQNSL
jgi:hypothetical protein